MNVGYLTFSVGDACYLYDTATNAIVDVPAAVPGILKDYLELGEDAVVRKFDGQWPGAELELAVDFLRTCRDQRMLEPIGRLDYLAFTDAAKLGEDYTEGLKVLTLGITERCNQRCSYCACGGAERARPRFGNMSWDTAKASIDYLIARSNGQSPITLDLFGGEPILHWNVLSRSFQYVREELGRPDIEIILYTNTTLLDAAKMELLITHNVALQISLDGPAQVHDKVRFMGDGRTGSHARVERALDWIRRRDRDYYRKNVRLHCTFSLDSDLLDVFHYFNQPRFREMVVTFGYRTGGPRPSDEDRARHDAQLDELVELYLQALRGHRPFHRGLMADILRGTFGTVAKRRLEQADQHPVPNSACVPGQGVVFVSGDGSLHPCSKHSPAASAIGDCRNGVDVTKAQELMRGQAELCNEMCQSCWAWRMCSHCYIHGTDADGRFSLPRKQEACRNERHRLTHALRRFVYLWQHEPASASRTKGTLRYTVTHLES